MVPSSVYIHLALHALSEMAAAIALVIWVGRGWAQTPAPFPVNLVRRPQRRWWMLGFGVAPALFSLLLSPLFHLIHSSGGDQAFIPISYGLSVIYGALLGLAASCCVAPADSTEEFRSDAALAVSAVVIFSFYFLNASALFWPFFLRELAAMAIPIVILSVTRWIMSPSAEPQAGPGAAAPPPIRRKLWPAIVIGFLPSALFLIAFAVATNKDINLGKDTSDALLWLCSGVSVVCCFTASIMLFKRSTGGAIAGGVILLLLNGFIGFFFGCCASINGSNLH